MTIEYLPGVKPGGKIDLSRFEKGPKTPAPETYLSGLNNQLESLAGRLNAEYGDFFEDNCQVKMAGADASSDQTLIAAKEKGWAADCGKTLATMAADREKDPANIAEIAATLLFDKILRGEFIVMRASVYDDYENGADQLIIDKRTGAVICGLDDAILGSSVKDDGEKKRTKIDKKMKNGGAEIRYGLAMNRGFLERQGLKHIPIFYFNLGKPDLNGLLASLATDSPDLTAAETATYTKMVDSLLEQADKYGADETLHSELKDNLQNFSPSLKKMRAHIQPN